MMAERIMTLHPEGKQGVNIDRAKYDQVAAAIEAALVGNEGMTFGELNEAMGEALTGRFDGSIGWYTTTVKLDLEARGRLERLPGRGPQRLRWILGGGHD